MLSNSRNFGPFSFHSWARWVHLFCAPVFPPSPVILVRGEAECGNLRRDWTPISGAIVRGWSRRLTLSHVKHTRGANIVGATVLRETNNLRHILRVLSYMAHPMCGGPEHRDNAYCTVS